MTKIYHTGAKIKNVSVVILAGGSSSRMGSPKLLLPFDKSQSFIEKIVSEYRKITGNIVLVLNAEVYKKNEIYFSTRFKGITIVLNNYPEYGRTHSIQMGLEMVFTKKAFIQNTDNPFVNKELLEQMILVAPDNGYVSPQVNSKGGHPVLLCGETVEKVKTSYKELNLRDILSEESKTVVDTDDETIVLDFNTPEIYNKYFSGNSELLHDKLTHI